MPRKRNKLGPIRAVWHACLGLDAGYFPRSIGSNGKEQSIETNDLIRRITAELGSVGPPPENGMEFLVSRGRESLDEVKELTEYQDQKATRNLTIITFLSALAGVLFSRFADLYPLRGILGEFGVNSWEGGLVIAGYGLFLAFVSCAVSGALVVFHATRIRFKYPELVKDHASGPLISTKSFLFFEEIIRVPPEGWAASFLEMDGAEGTRHFRKNLGLEYLRNYIIETYLIAAKVVRFVCTSGRHRRSRPIF